MKQDTLDALVSEARNYAAMSAVGQQMVQRSVELQEAMDSRIMAAGFDPAEIVKLAYAAQ